jgi:ferric-dicitrate binding protein FerR (iron transport regulator)
MNRFDDLIQKIREESINPEAAAAAAGRVESNLFGPGSEGADRITGCDGFQSLITAYLQRSLSETRRLLLEDHLRECVKCRKAVEQARSGGKVRPMPLSSVRQGARFPKWSMAAGVAAALALAVVGFQFWTGSFDRGPRATVETADGMLYRISSAGSLPLGEGGELGDGEEIRTPAGSRALLRLWDGSRIEMNERAELSVSRGWRGTTVRLERGHVIVQAAKQKQGRLFVTTGDSQVAVLGTIFSVNRGTLGSRVSVVEGQVEVRHGGRAESLKPGEQTSTHPALGAKPVQDEVAWSRDSARYIALLGELAALQTKLEAIPSHGLRYQSRLLVFVPEDTQLFVAIPNMAVTLTETRRIFEEHLRVSQVLREWWLAPANREMREEVEAIIDRLRELSGYVGEEIVFLLHGSQKNPAPLFLAQIRGSGLGEFLEQQMAEAGGKEKPFAYSIVDGVLRVAPDSAELKKVNPRAAAAATSFHRHIEQAYRGGVDWLLCANMEQIIPDNVKGKRGPGAVNLGLDSMQYLTIERKDIAGRVENRATLQFGGERQGVAGWLAAPTAMSTLNFVSPDAGASVSVVVKQPRVLVEEMFAIARQADARFDIGLAEIERRTGVSILDDLAGPLGSEATFAVDGPLLPIPSWKVAVEVNSPQRLQASIEKLISAASQEMAGKGTRIELTKEESGRQTLYRIRAEQSPGEIHYTYTDGYLIAAANRTLLTQAIQNRQTGYTLARSERFRSQLPTATNPNYSALVYHNLGGMFGALADQIERTANIPAEQKQSIAAVREAKPTVIAAYAEQDRITAATTGNLLGLNLGMLAGPGALLKMPLETRKQ